MTSDPATRWCTVNFAEAIQGVQTPLSWTFWSATMEPSLRQTFHRLGVLPTAEIPVPDDPNQRFSGIFYGRAAGNVSVFRRMGDRTPGSSGDAVEEQLFGQPRRPGLNPPTPGARWRYPVVAWRMPRAMVASARRLRPLREQQRTWWRQATIDRPPRDLPEAQQLLRDAADHFIEIGVLHAVVSMIGQALYEQLEGLAAAAWEDRAGALQLATGYGGMEETGLLEDIWLASRDRLDLETFVGRHGYHGPDEGNLTSRTWREDRAPLDELIASYRSSEHGNPREREREQIAHREAAEGRLLTALPRARRVPARLILRLAQALIPLRETGKAGFLHAIDGARCAARAAGRSLADAGVLDSPEDVFLLTYSEVIHGPGPDARALVVERRETLTAYAALALPPLWAGNPEPQPVVAEEAGPRPSRLRGIGIVGAPVKGRARVVLDPRRADLADGDVLVCRTTDPSWTPLFVLAGALVIDTGGAMSHGAIVARELGITCVINTGTGTRDIPDGAIVTVDGTTGVVDIHD